MTTRSGLGPNRNDEALGRHGWPRRAGQARHLCVAMWLCVQSGRVFQPTIRAVGSLVAVIELVFKAPVAVTVTPPSPPAPRIFYRDEEFTGKCRGRCGGTPARDLIDARLRIVREFPILRPRTDDPADTDDVMRALLARLDIDAGRPEMPMAGQKPEGFPDVPPGIESQRAPTQTSQVCDEPLESSIADGASAYGVRLAGWVPVSVYVDERAVCGRRVWLRAVTLTGGAHDEATGAELDPRCVQTQSARIFAADVPWAAFDLV